MMRLGLAYSHKDNRVLVGFVGQHPKHKQKSRHTRDSHFSHNFKLRFQIYNF
ncbi:MAG: hypothetical protein HRU03_09230 [Nanoarchaeales archaeon]|nr:hypothetical protein [Nanoarchaeales archaeon]